MLVGPTRRCESPSPIAHAEGGSRQRDPLFADDLDLSHSLAEADISGPMTGRIRPSTRVCSRDTGSWALAEGVADDYDQRIYRLSQLFGQVACFACSPRVAHGRRYAGWWILWVADDASLRSAFTWRDDCQSVGVAGSWRHSAVVMVCALDGCTRDDPLVCDARSVGWS